MWTINSLWFEVAIVTNILLAGHIFLGHFEERTPKWRKLLKAIMTLLAIISVSIFFGRTIAFIVLGIAFLPVIYIHGVVLPKKGINGWTGKPKAKYYEFRKWDKDIFNDCTQNNAGNIS